MKTLLILNDPSYGTERSFSATKYLGGHSDITAGVLMGAKGLIDAVWPWRKNLGTTPAPETAALLARSLRKLVVRDDPAVGRPGGSAGPDRRSRPGPRLTPA